MMTQRGFFDGEERLKRVSDLGDSLDEMREAIDFKGFRTVLDKALRRSDRRRGARLPFDAVLSGKTTTCALLSDPLHCSKS